MTRYYVMEVENPQSLRVAEPIMATCLTDAKRKASMRQVFQGTVLFVARGIDKQGFATNPICYKDNEGWHNVNA